jgi:hypothetical protein
VDELVDQACFGNALVLGPPPGEVRQWAERAEAAALEAWRRLQAQGGDAAAATDVRLRFVLNWRNGHVSERESEAEVVWTEPDHEHVRGLAAAPAGPAA